MQTIQPEIESSSCPFLSFNSYVSNIDYFHPLMFRSYNNSEIHRACQNLTNPNELDSLAVDARQELDLRIGAAFTRFQTMRFRNKFTGISEIVSYGKFYSRY